MLQLKNKWLTVQVSEQGAEIVSIRNTEGQEYIWQADPQYWKRHAPVLFPIVGSLWNGQYVHQGQTYKMSQHGFARDRKFRLIQHTCDSITLRLNANEETKKNYPFDFQLDITYRLTTNRVTTTWEVTNRGNEEMPFQIGGHPAFNIPTSTEKTWGYFQLSQRGHVLQEMICTPLAEKGCADMGKITDHLKNEYEENPMKVKGWGAVLTSGSYNSMTLYGSSSTTVTGATVPSTQLTWVYLTVVYDGATVSAYANGALVKSGTIASIVDDATKPLAFGALPNATSASVRGCYDECRLAGAVRSADWIAADYAAQSQADFLTPGDVLTPGLNAIVVDAAPERIGEPSDGYGNCFVDSDTVHFEMNTLAVTNETELSRRVCTGWTFVPKSGATIEGTGTVAKFPYTGTGTLYWQFTNLQYRVTAQTFGRATVAVDGGAPLAADERWVNEGDTVTLAVATEPGYNFLGWHGDVAAADQASTTLTFANLSAKRDVTAVAAVAVDNYVQDGLVMQLDGLENVVGAHDQTTTVWKDLAGNGYDFNLIAKKGAWAASGYDFIANQIATCAKTAAGAFENKISTIEFVWKTDEYKDATIFAPGHLAQYNIGPYLFTTKEGQVGFMSSQSTTNPRHAYTVAAGEWCTIALSSEGGEAYLRSVRVERR